jgi:hypothetical protein
VKCSISALLAWASFPEAEHRNSSVCDYTQSAYVGLLQQLRKIIQTFVIFLLRAAIQAYTESNRELRNVIKQPKHTFKGKYAVWAVSVAVSASLAFSPVLFPASAQSINASFNASATSWLSTFTPAGVDSRLARKFEQRKQAVGASQFPFTPAGIDKNHSRTMTVAARINQSLTVSAVSVRSAISSVTSGQARDIRLNPSDYRLSAARGWQGFTLPTAIKSPEKAPLLDISARGNYRLDGDAKRKPSRFNTNVSLDQTRQAAPSPRGTSASGEYSLNVGGSFSISRKIDVTAGVRYASERDRVAPQAIISNDSEAVYVGTKIRF